jgi:aryl-alcohol dehydrogenase-like predicted oxidoreductase
MQRRLFGRTGLEVTAMGMGCGGHSRLGRAKGKDEANAVAVVRRALDLGINIIDTAANYRTEPFVGEAIRGRRDEVVLATKFSPRRERLDNPELVREALEQSLRNLGTDRVDVYQVHGVTEDIYGEVVERLYPVLGRLRERGKIRFIGITEMFGGDTDHRMLDRAVEDDLWDTVMVGFNSMNPSARRVLERTRKKGIGVFCMFAIRRALADPELARELVLDLVEQGKVDGGKLDLDDPLGFLTADGVAGSIAEAGYRFCLHEPGLDCILSGTGNPSHLADNYRYLQMPPLPERTRAKLRDLFGHLDCVSGN